MSARKPLNIGQIAISQIEVNPKHRSAFPKLVLALKKLYFTPEYNEGIFRILEEKIVRGKKKTGVFLLTLCRRSFHAAPPLRDVHHTCFGRVYEGVEVIDQIRQGDEIEKILIFED